MTLASRTAFAETESAVFESATLLTPASRLDEIVLAQLSALGIQPVLCSDAVFVRRAYLDVIGTLPTARGSAGSSSRTRTRRTSGGC